MTNLETVKKILKKKFPGESQRIDAGDAYLICNRFLCNDAERSKMASELGLGNSKCGICPKNAQGFDCPFSRLPLNHCRNGIVEWLGMDCKQK